MQHDIELAVFYEPVSPVPEQAYFIRKMLLVDGYTQHLGVDSLKGVSASEIASLSNSVLAASQKLEEGRRCNGIVCLLPNHLSDRLGLVRLSQGLNLDSTVLLQLMIASPSRAVAVTKDESSGRILVSGFLAHEQTTRCLSFTLHGRRGASVSLCGSFIAAITPEAILTTNSATGQTASRSNREYLIGYALGRSASNFVKEPKSFARFELMLRCYSRLFHGVWAHSNGGCLIVCPSAEQVRPHLSIKFAFSTESGSFLLEVFESCFNLSPTNDDGPDGTAALPASLGSPPGSTRRLLDSLDWIGELSRIDGAVVMKSDLRLICFGAKVNKLTPDAELLIFDCIGSRERITARISNLGGTRHQSAASLVNAIDGAFALVSSQDGRATLLVKLEDKPLCAFINFQYLFDVPAARDLSDAELGFKTFLI